MTEVARIETVLPSWRFLVTDAMGVEAEEFRRWVQSWPLYGHADDLLKFSAQAVSWMPSKWPLICKLDQRLDGSISRAILHLAKGDIDTHQPGYLHLLSNMLHHARRVGCG